MGVSDLIFKLYTYNNIQQHTKHLFKARWPQQLGADFHEGRDLEKIYCTDKH
jgi:hypothetical protein